MRDTVQVDIKHFPIQSGDRFLLCCDGVSGMIEDPAIGEIMQAAGSDVEKAVSQVVEISNKNGGVDNITAIVLRCE